MKPDPRLLAHIEERARREGRDVNAVLAEALGVCPTCGQTMPDGAKSEVKRGRPVGAAAAGPTKRQEVERYMNEHPKATQAEIARAVGCSKPYVSQIAQERGRNGVKAPRGETDTT